MTKIIIKNGEEFQLEQVPQYNRNYGADKVANIYKNENGKPKKLASLWIPKGEETKQ